jgi:hypothetical protein
MFLWGEIAKGRMPSLTIIEALDERKERTARLVMGPEAHPIQQFTLQGSKEAFGQGVVVTIAGRAHGTADAQSTTLLGEHRRGILAAVIRMVSVYGRYYTTR